MWNMGRKGWPLDAIPTPTPAAPGATGAWFKITVLHTALQAAALTNDIELFTLPAGGIIHGVKLKHSVTFAGTGITSYDLAIGFTGELEALLPYYDVTTAPANDTFALSHTFDSRNHAATVSVRVAAVAVGANLDQSTGGTAEIWLFINQAI